MSAHIPVMKEEMLRAVAARDGEIIVDGTFGAGGYSRAILQSAPAARVIAFDRDPNVEILADALARDYPGHFLFFASRFSAMLEVLLAAGITQVDAVVLDIGVSSMQLDQAERGFSFSKDAPLDMRMSTEGRTAADIVNQADEAELMRILREYGEERDAKRIARAIIHSRQLAPILSTKRLAEIISETVHAHGGMKIHPATRTFQALRIEVNQELEELKTALAAAEKLLRPGGRLVIISFHSLEDRIVKQFMLQRSTENAAPSRHSPASLLQQDVAAKATFELTPKSAIAPSEQEVTQNPRARSAKLRCATRTANPVPHAA